jgi:predicted DsbA family dithiol-disulfide isomerase
MRVEVWSDINCPWCYIGKARFEKALAGFPHREEIELVHRSFELDPNAAREARPIVPLLVAKFGMSTEQVEAGEARIEANAKEEGLPYLREVREGANSFDMHRLLHFAKENGRQLQLLDALYRAHFGEKRSAFETDRLIELAVEVGLDREAAAAVLADPDAYAAAVREDEETASEMGARGVPFFVLDRRLGVSGAQPTETFAKALEQAWESRVPVALVPVAGAEESGEACGPDGCELPRR